MSRFSRWAKRALGRSIYDEAKALLVEAAVSRVTSEVHPWLAARLQQTGFREQEAAQISDELLERVKMALTPH